MNSSGSATEITERSVNDLRPPERSVRTHNRAQERKLTRIIRKHGIVAPDHRRSEWLHNKRRACVEVLQKARL
jgi:hypothetical protein